MRDAEREAFISAQPEVKEIEIVWECDIRRQLESDRQMQESFESYRDEGPIKIRDAFMGGRTGPFKLYKEAGDGKRISYYDITSLYPFVK